MSGYVNGIGDRFQAFLGRARLILMTPHGRAGSLFVHGLLDGHPNIISLPYFINKYIVDPQGTGVEARVRAFLDANRELFAARGLLKIESEHFRELDRAEVERDMLVMLATLKREPTSRDILCALFCAVALARGGDLSHYHYVAVHQHLYDGGSYLGRRQHCTLQHERLMEDFPGGVYLALMLQPTLSMASYLRESCDLYTLRYQLVYLKSCHIALRRLLHLRPDYQTVLLDIDEINSSGGKTLVVALRKVGVQSHVALSVCTYVGVPWQGISALNTALATFNPESRQHKEAYIIRQAPESRYAQYLAFSDWVLRLVVLDSKTESMVKCAPLRVRWLLGFFFSEAFSVLRKNFRSVRGLRVIAASMASVVSDGIYLLRRYR